MHRDLLAALAVSADLRASGLDDAASLADRLYAWYLNPVPLPAPVGPLLPYEVSLAAVLRAAHSAAVRFEGGWRADSVSNRGRAVAKKGDLSRIVERGEYAVAGRTGRSAEPGDALLVCSRWDWLDEDTGYWHARRGEWPPRGADRLVRTYWNCPPRTVASLVAEITRVFDAAAGVPYMLKTAAMAEHGGRADALVLYTGPDGFATVEDGLRRIASLAALQLRPETPRMTLRLGAGVGLAEGRIDGDSFGQVRCGIVADVVGSQPRSRQSDSKAVQWALEEVLRERGLDPERPYLEPQPSRDYVV